jgi:hypothetical protein
MLAKIKVAETEVGKFALYVTKPLPELRPRPLKEGIDLSGDRSQYIEGVDYVLEKVMVMTELEIPEWGGS